MNSAANVVLRFVALVVFSAAALHAQTSGDPRVHAMEVFNDIATGQFAKIEAQYSPEVAAALPPGRLAQAWSQLTSQVGAFKSVGSTSVQEVGGQQVIVLVTVFERATLDTLVAFNAGGRLSGLRFVPHQNAATRSGPNYANPGSFHEQAITVVFRHWELPGTLTVPNGNGPFPLVVLVQGSGPQDEDETIGPNKPFKDLAWGLGSRGIAVLRYTKRTKQYLMKSSNDPQDLTVRDEVIDDARAAVALGAKQSGIDPKRVYVLGHSLGGYLAPRIADDNPQIAGLIIMAGSTRPLAQIFVDQVRYLMTAEGVPADEAAKQIATAEQEAKAIDSPTLARGETLDYAGAKIPASYFLDLRGYHPAELAAKLNIPILVLQGARDYQVTMADYDGWKRTLAGPSNATFKLYPGLTHLFMESSSPGTGRGTPQDYSKPGHVSTEVVQDIAFWINNRDGAVTRPSKP